MNERERLIELLDDIQRCGEDYTEYERYGTNYPDTVSNENIADHLLAHGVTIPAQGRLVKHNYLGHEQWTCSECQTLVSPQWKCCPVCEARMPEPPKDEE